MLLVALALAASACGDDDGGSDADPDGAAASAADLDGRTFVATETVGFELVEGTSFTLVFEDGSLAAVAGCNTMIGAFDVVDGALSVDALLQTAMACEAEFSEQDDQVQALLTGQPAVTVTDEQLVLATDDVSVTFGDTGAVEAAHPLDGGVWVIESIDGPDGSVSAPEGAYLQYAEGDVFVSTGCNRGVGSLEVSDDTVTIGPIAVTMMMCEPDVAAWESELLQLLSQPLGWELDGDQLTLTAGEQSIISRFLP
jgi:heat shock protein HslJ